jgi:hypothetical protein
MDDLPNTLPWIILQFLEIRLWYQE